MTELDEPMVQLLRDAVPIDGKGDWERVVRDAERERRARRWRLAAAGALAAAVVLIPLAALGASDGWWFLGARHAPSPSGSVIVVKSVRTNGVPWALTAYQANSGALCVGLTPFPPSSRPTPPAGATTSAILSCVSLRGLRRLPAGAKPQWISFATAAATAGKPGDSSRLVAGAAADGVTTVDVILGSGTTITTKTFPAPSALDLPARFYLVSAPPESTVRAVVARGPTGGALERVPVPGR